MADMADLEPSFARNPDAAAYYERGAAEYDDWYLWASGSMPSTIARSITRRCRGSSAWFLLLLLPGRLTWLAAADSFPGTFAVPQWGWTGVPRWHGWLAPGYRGAWLCSATHCVCPSPTGRSNAC